MAGVHAQPAASREGRRFRKPRELARARGALGVGVAAGVELHEIGPGVGAGADRVGVGIDEHRHLNPALAQLRDGALELLALSHRVEAAFRRDLEPVLRHEADLVRANLARELEDRRGHRRFEIQERLHRAAQHANVALLDVPAVFPQMYGDAIGAGQLAERRRRHRIGLCGAARLTNGGDVIDIDVEARHGIGSARGEAADCSSLAPMRIISGTLRGRPLLAPRDDRTRPMLEKTRGAIFSILGDAVEGARVLDLYSGTGSLGLEALSRGAVAATFVERDRTAFGFLERNLEELGVGERATALRAPVEAAVRAQAAASADLIFLDPPYIECEDKTRRPALVALLAELRGRVLAPGGTLLLHFPVGDFEPCALAILEGADVREYGRNGVALLTNASS